MALPVNKRVLKILFILFVVAFCIYLIPRIAINFFYYPDDKIYGPDPWSAESVEFTAKDGTRLHGWFIPSATGPAENAIATIIHAHGNAGNMSAHWPLVSWLPERNFNVFMFDYRGFGKSKGTPSQAGLLDDTQSAINVVRHRSDVNPQRLVLFGQSIGGANILDVIGQGDREGIRAVILDSTFASYATIANQKIHEWLALFKQHALPLLDDIGIARSSQNSEKIKRAAHQLKSSCSSLGMRSASQLCAQLEQQPLSAPLPHEEITRSVAALEAWLNKKDLNAI